MRCYHDYAIVRLTYLTGQARTRAWYSSVNRHFLKRELKMSGNIEKPSATHLPIDRVRHLVFFGGTGRIDLRRLGDGPAV